MSSMLNNIPCAISLCGISHKAITGEIFATREKWWKYLLSLTNSCGVLEEKKVLGKRHMILKVK